MGHHPSRSRRREVTAPGWSASGQGKSRPVRSVGVLRSQRESMRTVANCAEPRMSGNPWPESALPETGNERPAAETPEPFSQGGGHIEA